VTHLKYEEPVWRPHRPPTAVTHVKYEEPVCIARGFRNLANYRLRMLLIGGGLTDPRLP
jgi:hypothetical protein